MNAFISCLSASVSIEGQVDSRDTVHTPHRQERISVVKLPLQVEGQVEEINSEPFLAGVSARSENVSHEDNHELFEEHRLGVGGGHVSGRKEWQHDHYYAQPW